jgi:hypothetical protein
MTMSSVSASRYTAIMMSTVSSAGPSPRASDNASAIPGEPQDSAVVTFSAKAQELLKMRDVSGAQQETFKHVLQKAESANAQADPKAFLRTMTGSEMDALQMAHSLAQPIDVNSINEEGAANLLAQPGSEKDIDNNGLTSIGAGNFITFPPNDAPESFKAAWATATAGKSFGDIPSQMIVSIGISNMHPDPVTGQPVAVAPNDPAWRNPYADVNYDYAGAVHKIMDGLSYDKSRNLISETQFKHDMDFYERLSTAMG